MKTEYADGLKYWVQSNRCWAQPQLLLGLGVWLDDNFIFLHAII